MNSSLAVNIVIMVVKFVSFVFSGSLSVLASLMDSLLDIVSQYVLFWTEKKSRLAQENTAIYPAGANRLEPVGVIVCATLMGVGSFTVISESIQAIVRTLNGNDGEGANDASNDDIKFALGVMLGVVVIKLALWRYCAIVIAIMKESGAVSSLSSVEAVGQDHLNDILSNAIAAIALIVFLVDDSYWYFDPAGAILISFFIIHSWWATGKEEIDKIAGVTASREFIGSLTMIGDGHHEEMKVDVTRAYYFGPKFLVEMEVVMPGSMTVAVSHEIGMDLQYKLEKHPEVERAFVHIDYQTRDYDEHSNSKKFSYEEQLSFNNTSPTNNRNAQL